MTKRNFFALMGSILLIITAFFAFKISAMYNNDCRPVTGNNCYNEWEYTCQNYYLAELIGWSYVEGSGTCYDGDCMGFYRILCFNASVEVFSSYYDVCVDTGNWICTN